MECLRAAMISEHISQTFENDNKHTQVKDKPIKTHLLIQHQEIYSFIRCKSYNLAIQAWNKKLQSLLMKTKA